MTGDEMERAIEFLLKHQADFDARMTRLEATQVETSQQIRELTTGHQQTREFLDELTQIVAQNSRDIAQNSREIAQNSQNIAQNSQQISHLSNIVENVVEGQNRTRDDIDALVKLVGGVIEGRNGKSQS